MTFDTEEGLQRALNFEETVTENEQKSVRDLSSFLGFPGEKNEF